MARAKKRATARRRVVRRRGSNRLRNDSYVSILMVLSIDTIVSLIRLAICIAEHARKWNEGN